MSEWNGGTLSDEVLNIRGNRIQQGPDNDRVYLFKPRVDNLDGMASELLVLAKEYGRSKVVAKIPSSSFLEFERFGYVVEAVIPRLYRGKDNGLLMSFFIDPKRASPERNDFDKLMDLAISKQQSPRNHNPDVDVKLAKKQDADSLVELYSSTFGSYPFPINDPAFIAMTMDNNSDYFMIKEEGKIIAAASAEINHSGENAEMTDFAVLPSHRGRGLAIELLAEMEHQVKKKGIKVAYTIARASSIGINRTFARLRYEYRGRLVKNADICDQLESMNVWSKDLCSIEHPTI